MQTLWGLCPSHPAPHCEILTGWGPLNLWGTCTVDIFHTRLLKQYNHLSCEVYSLCKAVLWGKQYEDLVWDIEKTPSLQEVVSYKACSMRMLLVLAFSYEVNNMNIYPLKTLNSNTFHGFYLVLMKYFLLVPSMGPFYEASTGNLGPSSWWNSMRSLMVRNAVWISFFRHALAKITGLF